ncbi:hypothetical protein EDB19DRAFT_1691031, partial [Suillus lakei]
MTSSTQTQLIFEILTPDIRRNLKTLKESVQWTDLMPVPSLSPAQSLQEIHARGRTHEEIEHTLRQMPFTLNALKLVDSTAMVRGVTNLKRASNPTTTFSASLTRTLFSSTPFSRCSEGLQNLFGEIVTNPAEFDPSGLLKLRRRVDPNRPQHSCTVGCSPNMCKGEELTAFLERHKPGYDRIVY